MRAYYLQAAQPNSTTTQSVLLCSPLVLFWMLLIIQRITTSGYTGRLVHHNLILVIWTADYANTN